MDRLVIQGGRRLHGEVQVGGAKNSVLPIMAAALLTDEEVVIRRVPRLRDVTSQARILQSLGARVLHDEKSGILRIRTDDETQVTAPYDLVKHHAREHLRARPAARRRRRARVSLPGGCVIGVRPIDLHLQGPARRSARGSRCAHGYVEAERRASARATALFLGGERGLDRARHRPTC